MGNEIFIIRTTGQYSGHRRWFVDKDWSEDFYESCVDAAKPGEVIELIQMSMDYLIDYALDDLLDGPFTNEGDEDYRVLERHNA